MLDEDLGRHVRVDWASCATAIPCEYSAPRRLTPGGGAAAGAGGAAAGAGDAVLYGQGLDRDDGEGGGRIDGAGAARVCGSDWRIGLRLQDLER